MQQALVTMAVSAGFSSLLVVAACSRTPPPTETTSGKGDAASTTSGSAAAAASAMPVMPAGASPCTAGPAGAPPCFRFATQEDAFRHVLGRDPLVLAIGEAHAQRGTEAISSSTKRFTESFLPILAPRTTDVVVELWAPDPKCMKEVKQVASAQKPVTDVQAATNQNEYVTLGTKAKEAGITPWLLRPTCDDFSMLADAGADTVGASLGLIKRLTQTKVTNLYNQNKADAGAGGGAGAGQGAAAKQKIVIAYGGALHNDLAPSEAMKDYSFGPELDRVTSGRYIELDLIVPEFVKKTPAWEKLPWFASFDAERAGGKPIDKTMLYVVGDKSFVLVFPSSSTSKATP